MTNLNESIILLEDILTERARWKKEGLSKDDLEKDYYSSNAYHHDEKISDYRVPMTSFPRANDIASRDKKVKELEFDAQYGHIMPADNHRSDYKQSLEKYKKEQDDAYEKAYNAKASRRREIENLHSSQRRAQMRDEEIMEYDKARRARELKKKNSIPEKEKVAVRNAAQSAKQTSKKYLDKVTERATDIKSRATGAIRNGISSGRIASKLHRTPTPVSENEAITELGLYLKDISTLYECGRSNENDELCVQILGEAVSMIELLFNDNNE